MNSRSGRGWTSARRPSAPSAAVAGTAGADLLDTVLDTLTTSKRRWRGGNASAWRADVLAVNGYDNGMGYGGQDAELGERLDNLGLRHKRVRFRAMTVHLWHERP